MRVTEPLATALCAIALLSPAGAAAQEEAVEEVGGTALSAAIGTTAGLVGGGYANLALVVLKARMGHYQHEFKEAFGWESIPIATGAGIGFSIGLWDHDRLWRWIIGGAAGWAVGAGAGYAFGALMWGDSESKWSNAAIGAALGLAAGSTAALFLPRSGDDDGGPGTATQAVAVPLFTVRF